MYDVEVMYKIDRKRGGGTKLIERGGYKINRRGGGYKTNSLEQSQT